MMKVLSSVLAALPLFATAQGASCTVFNNTDINPHTSGLGSIPATSIEQCCAACSSEEWWLKGCRFYTLSIGSCWLKADNGTVVPSAGHISGKAIAPPAPAHNFTVARVLSSNMVLQQAPAAANVWGWATPGTAVTVTLDGGAAARTSTADSNGTWVVALSPQHASMQARSIGITSSNGGKATLSNVLFGDVLFCSGQSHMTFSVNQDMDGASTIANSTSFPGLRMLTVDSDTSTSLVDDIKAAKGALYNESSWLVSTPASFGADTFGHPSAICYYTARSLYAHFQGKVPIGIVAASVGGSAIRFWMSSEALNDKTCGGVNLTASCPLSSAAAEVATRHKVVVDDSTTAHYKNKGWTNAGFYHAMVHPLARMQLKAILWDQGEANDGDHCARYGCKLSSLAQSWRKDVFKQPDLTFSFDQMRPGLNVAGGAGMVGYDHYIPNSVYTTRVDLQTCLANGTSAGHAIRKLEVGRRLALTLRVAAYGETPTALSYGPIIKGLTSRAMGKLLNVSITFNNAEGIHHVDAPECAGCCNGRTGTLIQGVPVSGDAWSFVFSDGSTSGVCKESAMGCDGKANIRAGGTLDVLVVAPPSAGVVIVGANYGGDGPWLGDEGSAVTREEDSVLKCVYPHGPRFGIEACGLANGKGGYDDHAGIGMAAQMFRVAK